MSDLREEFKQDSLPIDDNLLTFDLDEATEIAHAHFLTSLRSSPQVNCRRSTGLLPGI